MKIYFKVMTIAAMTAAIALTGCSKESGGIDTGDGETTSVSLRLVDGAASRAVGAPVAASAKVNFTSGYVIFTNAVNSINKVTEIVAGAYPGSPSQADIDAKAAGTKVWLDELESSGGSEIKNVPDASKTVYIVGNLPSGATVPVLGMNISTIQDQLISIQSQGNTSGTVANVTLYGDGVTLGTHPTITDAKFASVQVDAIASRFEIGSVSYSNPSNFITKFQIDGIFINYYYPNMSLASKVSTVLADNAPANNSAADAMYSPNASGPYFTADDGILYDYDIAGTGLGDKVTDISWKADAGSNVWAYNVLAPKNFASPVTKIEAPHIIVRLSDIETTDDNPTPVYTTTQYITVKDFRLKNGGTDLNILKPGYVYYITDLQFNESHLSEIPEAKAVTAYVEAVLMTWSREEIEWGN